MTLRHKIFLFTVKHFENHSIKLDREELLSFKYTFLDYLRCPKQTRVGLKIVGSVGCLEIIFFYRMNFIYNTTNNNVFISRGLHI